MLQSAYPLKTRRLLLRPYRPEDLEALYDIQSRHEVARYLYWFARTRAEVQEALAVRITNSALRAENDRVILAVVRQDTGILIGDVNLSRISREHWQGEVGFAFHPDHQGCGFASEAAEEMLRLGFVELGFHRIVGRCDTRNVASANVLERLGMRREAHFRQNEFVKGEWCDEYLYALLATEWRATRWTS